MPKKNTQQTTNTHRSSTSGRPGKPGPAKAPRHNRRQTSRSGARAARFGRHMPRPANVSHTGSERRGDDTIPALAEGTIRVIPLGGVEEIGRNMTAVEFGDDIVVIDCGFQFREEDTPGVDYILPNTKYLEERKDKVRAVIITHGHLDHIGAIPFVLDRIGNPPIYTRRLTNVIIKKRQEEFPEKPALTTIEVEHDQTVRLGKHISTRFFKVTHSIPDAMGVLIDTPCGTVVATGDLKVDHKDGVPLPEEEKAYAFFDKENVLMLLSDSTNAVKPGWSIPEETVLKNIENIIVESKNRLIIGTFASQLDRIIKIIEMAERNGKKVVVEGRSMKTNIEIVKKLGILKAKQDTFIPLDQMDDYPPERIVALVTGAQGDEFAALMRMSNKTHKYFKVTNKDTILFSSSTVPGNERSVQKLMDNLARQGAHIIHSQMVDVHTSGHANQEEIKWLHRKIQPRFFMPMHGYHYMLRVHADLAVETGMPREHIVVPDNSTIVEIRNEGTELVRLPQKAPSSIRSVDGLAIGDMQDVVIRDRKALAQDGMFVIIGLVSLKTGKLRKSPDIISRGFVYLRESQDMLQETRLLIKRTIESNSVGANPINFDYIKDKVSEDVTAFLFQKTNKHPIVIPVLIGV